MALSLPKVRYLRVLIGVAIAGVLVACYIAGAGVAWSGYQARLTSTSLSYDGHLEFTGQDFLAPMNSNMAFSGGVNRAPDFASSTQFLGTLGGHEYSGEARVTGGKLYINISGPQMPVIRYRQSSFLVPLVADTWYSENLGESLYDNFCDHRQPAPLSAKVDLYRTLKTLKVSPSPWVNFLSVHDGLHTIHLSGSLSGAQLAQLYSAASKAQPPGCDSFNTLGFSADDLKHVSTHLDLYTNKDRDELQVTLTDKTLGATATMVLSTYRYNEPVQVTLPAAPVSLEGIFATAPAPMPSQDY